MADEHEEVDREEVEREARAMGWSPKDQFKGNPNHWVDADEFVERGRSVMPILVENNKRLAQRLSTRDAEIDTLKARLESADVAIQKLEQHYTAANKRAVETARQQLKEELKAAREDNDIDAELDIQDKIRDLDKASDPEPDKKPAKKDKPQEPTVSPEFKAWAEDNPWFGTDKKKTKAVTRIAEDLREDGNPLTGRAFMDECVRVYEEQTGEVDDGRPPAAKVESAPGRGGGRSGGKTFADLPAEAKRACHDDIDDLVGEGKRYKTQKDWESAYAKIYFSE